MKFESQRELTDHLTKHTGEKLHTCETCRKTFRYSNNLTRHSKLHSNHRKRDRTFKCDICEIKFESKRDLSDHLTKHTGEKLHICETSGNL